MVLTQRSEIGCSWDVIASSRGAQKSNPGNALWVAAGGVAAGHGVKEEGNAKRTKSLRGRHWCCEHQGEPRKKDFEVIMTSVGEFEGIIKMELVVQ